MQALRLGPPHRPETRWLGPTGPLDADERSGAGRITAAGFVSDLIGMEVRMLPGHHLDRPLPPDPQTNLDRTRSAAKPPPVPLDCGVLDGVAPARLFRQCLSGIPGVLVPRTLGGPIVSERLESVSPAPSIDRRLVSSRRLPSRAVQDSCPAGDPGLRVPALPSIEGAAPADPVVSQIFRLRTLAGGG